MIFFFRKNSGFHDSNKKILTRLEQSMIPRCMETFLFYNIKLWETIINNEYLSFKK